MTPTDAWTIADPTLCPVCGRDSCEDHLPAPAPTVVRANRPPPLAFVTADAMIATPRPIEIIEGLAWAGSVTVLVSESGAGKTFVMLSAAAAVSSDTPWQGRAVRGGSVAYCSFEGDALGLRLQALRDVSDHSLAHLYVARPHAPLSPRIDRDGEQPSLGEHELTGALVTLAAKLQTAGRPPIVLVVIDTVRASLAGSEDSSEHVSAYLRAVRRIMTCAPGAAAILVHHAGWQDGENQRKRERGSSAWRGNCDATVYLETSAFDVARGDAALTLRTLKVRDADKPAPLYLRRRRVTLNERDRHGEPVTSCVIEPDHRSREDRAAELAAGTDATRRTVDLAVLKAMRDAPAATSISRLGPYVGQRTAVVRESVARLIQASWALPGKRGQPFMLTPAGCAQLDGAIP